MPALFVSCAVSPPTRGWARGSHLQAGPLIGFPAHAGMDPESDRRFKTTQRFPRPRGDGPRKRLRRRQESTVSPPTRGWTLLTSPATPLRTRFPRPRGDGPYRNAVFSVQW